MGPAPRGTGGNHEAPCVTLCGHWSSVSLLGRPHPGGGLLAVQARRGLQEPIGRILQGIQLLSTIPGLFLRILQVPELRRDPVRIPLPERSVEQAKGPHESSPGPELPASGSLEQALPVQPASGTDESSPGTVQPARSLEPASGPLQQAHTEAIGQTLHPDQPGKTEHLRQDHQPVSRPVPRAADLRDTLGSIAFGRSEHPEPDISLPEVLLPLLPVAADPGLRDRAPHRREVGEHGRVAFDLPELVQLPRVQAERSRRSGAS